MIVIYEEINKMTVDEMILFLKKFEKESFLAGRISVEENKPIPRFSKNDDVMRKWLMEECVYDYFVDSNTDID